ncbi:MAG: DUF192 domain-containing protein [Myxococcota bacterium]
MLGVRFSGLGLALLVACSGSSASDDGNGKPHVAPTDGDAEPSQVVFHAASGDVVVTVEIADSPTERSQGLMNRRTLGADQGMIFMFPSDEVQSFWMKNTLIPLDMIFVNSGLEVVGVVPDAEPMTTTPRTVDAPAAYVVEVNGGFAAANGIAAGVRMTLRGMSTTLPAH